MSRNHRHVPYRVAFKDVTGLEPFGDTQVTEMSHEEYLSEGITWYRNEYRRLSASSITNLGTVFLVSASLYDHTDDGFIRRDVHDRKTTVLRNKLSVADVNETITDRDSTGNFLTLKEIGDSATHEALDVIIRSGILDKDGYIGIDDLRHNDKTVIDIDGEKFYYESSIYNHENGYSAVIPLTVYRFNDDVVRVSSYRTEQPNIPMEDYIEVVRRSHAGYHDSRTDRKIDSEKKSIRQSTRAELKDMADEYNTYGDIEDDDIPSGYDKEPKYWM